MYVVHRNANMTNFHHSHDEADLRVALFIVKESCAASASLARPDTCHDPVARTCQDDWKMCRDAGLFGHLTPRMPFLTGTMNIHGWPIFHLCVCECVCACYSCARFWASYQI